MRRRTIAPATHGETWERSTLRARCAPSTGVTSDHRPPDAEALGPTTVLRLQRLVGNGAVVELQRQRARSSAEAAAAGLAPYYGRRMRNPDLDVYEHKKNIFIPPIFFDYGRNPSPWRPLRRVLDAHYLRHVQQPRLTKDENAAAWGLLERLEPRSVADIREHVREPLQEAEVVGRLLSIFGADYRFAYRRAHAEWLASDFRLNHEWLAIRFGLVKPPCKHWAKPQGR